MQTEHTLILPARPETLTTLAHYEIVREVGRGGMSVVYEARDGRTHRTVALKVLTMPQGLARKQQEDMLARFGREAHAMAGLSHPNIVTIHELGEEKGHHFLVMEYLRGETLRQRLARGPLTPAQALPILTQIAQALDAVHAQGVVHRDIKPSNVILLPDGTAKLLDFGIARQSDDTTVTNTGAIVGSPAYMSPEQIRGEPGTPASDLWALGVLLYETLAGHPPFTGGSIPAVLYQVTHENPVPVVGLPTPVQRVLRRALDKNPQRRHPTAVALADALHDALPEFRPSAPGVSRFVPTRRPWIWAALLIPVLIGISLVALIRNHPPTTAPSVPMSHMPISGRRTETPKQPTRRRSTHRGIRRAPGKKAAPRHRAVRPKHARPRRHHRRLPHIHRFRFGHARSHFDPTASAHLQQFIWGEGR